MTCRVVGIGESGIDHVAVVDRYPEPESNTELVGLSIQGGGAIANALATLANLRIAPRFVGLLSDDDFGRFIVRGLEGMGIDLAGLVVEPNHISPYRFIVLERERHRRTILRTAGNVGRLDAARFEPSWLDGAEILLIDGYHIGAQVAAAEEARRRGIKVVLDAGSLHEGMGELVPLCDVLVASERYASEVAPRGEIEDSLIELSRMGPQTVVVTLGEEGSIGLEGDKLVRQPSLTVNVVDPTGAGDVYLGGYCYGLAVDWPLERCMQVASAAAGLSCREIGCRAGLPSVDEVLAAI